MFGVHLENFPTCREYAIEVGEQTSINSTLSLYDNDNRLLELRISVLMHVSGSLKVWVAALSYDLSDVQSPVNNKMTCMFNVFPVRM